MMYFVLCGTIALCLLGCTCGLFAVKDQKSMIFLITSGIPNADRRHACRLTWLTWVTQLANVDYLFYAEKPISNSEEAALRSESDVFKDLIVANVSRPRGKRAPECATRRWDMLQYAFGKYSDKFDYYVVVDDDSFVCIDHLLHDAQFWPADRRIHVSHFRKSTADVISIYGAPVVRDALAVLASGPAERTSKYLQLPLQSMISDKLLNDVDVINDLRLLYGAHGSKNTPRVNDWKNGWIGVNLLSDQEKLAFCEQALSGHQVYPPLMIDLWAHMVRHQRSYNYSTPYLSRNIVDYDATP